VGNLFSLIPGCSTRREELLASLFLKRLPSYKFLHCPFAGFFTELKGRGEERVKEKVQDKREERLQMGTMGRG